MTSLSHLQMTLPWTIPYSPSFVSASHQLPHLDMQHAMIHVQKSMGKLADCFDKMDHGNEHTARSDDVPNLVADLVVCALRMANTSPWGTFDLEKAVIARLEGRNHATIPEEKSS